MKSEPLFWLVWCDGGNAPTRKHPHISTARAEAQRLARANPGQRFVVLAAALGYVKRDLDEVTYVQPNLWDEDLDDEIPF